MKPKFINFILVFFVVFSFLSCSYSYSEDKQNLVDLYQKFSSDGIGYRDIKIVERMSFEEVSSENQISRDYYENIYYINATDNFYYVSHENKDSVKEATILDQVEDSLRSYHFTVEGYDSVIISDSMSREEFLENVDSPKIIVPYRENLSGDVLQVDVARIHSPWSSLEKQEEEFLFDYLQLPRQDIKANDGSMEYEYEIFKNDEYIFRAHSEYVTEDNSTVEFNYVLLLFLMDTHNYYCLMDFWRYSLEPTIENIDIVWEPDTNFDFRIEANNVGYAKVKLEPGKYEITSGSFSHSELNISLLNDEGEEITGVTSFYITESGYYFIEVTNLEDKTVNAYISVRSI